MRRRGGFTILELLVSVTLIAACAAFSIRVYFASPEITLENASVLLAHDLRAAQNRSAYLAEACTFRFLEDGDGYSVSQPDGTLVTNPRTQRTFERRYSSDGVFRGIEVLEVRSLDGRALSIDDVGRMQNEVEIVLSFGEHLRVIKVERRTGRVTIVGSTSGWRDRGY